MSIRRQGKPKTQVRFMGDGSDMPKSSTPVATVKIPGSGTLTISSMFAVSSPEETGDGRWKITFAYDGQTYVGISPSAHDAVVQVIDNVKHASAEAMTALRQYLAMWRDAVKQKEEEQQ